eukprot:TRINITY_DN64440_c1_g4_i1.p1 TRINITY_DN64440_c1_g4~~TRINITY_DN64440_c1_g4_i1.p1  ORF type:complete len:406 (-),score=30.13 TRINITY_DN64440_c1_g4_i1:900-2117(-)
MFKKWMLLLFGLTATVITINVSMLWCKITSSDNKMVIHCGGRKHAYTHHPPPDSKNTDSDSAHANDNNVADEPPREEVWEPSDPDPPVANTPVADQTATEDDPVGPDVDEEWLKSLDERNDCSVDFSVPIPAGKQLRNHIKPCNSHVNQRGKNGEDVARADSRTVTEQDCADLKHFLFTVEYKCKDKRRIGHEGDGGWFVCFDRPLPSPSNKCTLYSCGLAYDWSFDMQISELCHDHGFDPTLKVVSANKNPKKRPLMKDTKHMEGHNFDFYSMGLSGDGLAVMNTGKRIPTMTLQAGMKALHHSHIDILKIDIEGSEWTVIHSMKDWEDSPLDRVDQILMEMHFVHYGFWYVQEALQILKKKGFMLYTYHENPECAHTKLVGSSCTLRRCMEVTFIKNGTDLWT